MRSHPTSRATPPAPCERIFLKYPLAFLLTHHWAYRPVTGSGHSTNSGSTGGGLLCGADFGRLLDRLPSLSPPSDISPRRHGDPADAQRDPGEDVADEVNAEHDPGQC